MDKDGRHEPHGGEHCSIQILTMRLFFLFLILSASAAAADLFPAERLAPWTAGTYMGVQGGFERYLPGGANQRTDLIDVTQAPYSADRTGATNAATAINSAITAATSGQVVYIPAGRYKLEGGIGGGLKDNYTIRGEGQFFLSRSTHTIGTGEKTFTVPAGGPWEAGIGVRVWKWDRDDAWITSITRSGSTATVTTEVPHLRASGEAVYINGPAQAEYCGSFIITVTGDSTFTYQVTGSPASPATTSTRIRYRDASYAFITSITRSGTTATVTTVQPHAKSGTFSVTISGATQPEYNGVFTATVTSDTTFTYTVSGSPATPATTSTFLLYSDGRQEGANMWMDGEVVSYSGTTLVLDFSDSENLGTWSMWKVSGTILDFQGASGNAIRIGSDSNYLWLTSEYSTYMSAPLIDGSVSKGDTSFTVDIGSFGEPSVGDMMQLGIRNNYEADEGYAGTSSIIISSFGYEYNLRQIVRITNVSNAGGNNRTITFFPAVVFDMPSARVPKATWFGTSGYAENVGVESLAITGSSSTTPSALLSIIQTINCWAYDVGAYASHNYNAEVISSLWTSVHGSWFTHVNRQPSSNMSGLLASWSSGGLYENSVFGVTSFPSVEMNSFTYNAFSYCYAPGKVFNPNHAPHNMMNLFEGCLFMFSLDDGYFGGSGGNTYLRNWAYGFNDGYVVQGSINLRRWAYNTNAGGNVLGTPSFADGAMGYGLPNIGNGSYYGNASALSNDYWTHLTGKEPVQATLTTRTSDDTATFTLTTLTASVFQDPYIWNGETSPFVVRWGSSREARFSLVASGWSGSTIVFSGGSGTNYPATSTAVEIWASVPGFQELDDDVESTTLELGNWFVSGSGGSQSPTGGPSIPDSYLYASRPSWYASSLTFPAMNPAAPNFDDAHALIPVGYLYLNGENADSASGTQATVSGTTTVTGTLTAP